MSVRTNAGCRLFIGPSVPNIDGVTPTTLAAMSFIEIDELVDLAEIGDAANAIDFSTLNDGRVRRLKGQRDGGQPAFTFGRDFSDPGQAAMRAAFRADENYAFKLEREGDDVIDYFCGLVLGERESYGTADNVVTVVFTVAINTEVFRVET